MKVFWRDTAIADLRRIRAWIARENPRVAQIVVRDIRAQTLVLKKHPFKGQEVFAGTGIRHLVIGYIRVFYRASDDAVVILRIRDSRRSLLDPDRIGERPADYLLAAIRVDPERIAPAPRLPSSRLGDASRDEGDVSIRLQHCFE